MRDDLFDFLVGDERPMHARYAPAPRHVQHVALTKQLLGALLAQNRAAVDFGGDLKRNAGREIRLDRAGDDIDGGPLRRHDEVNAGGARHLGEPLDRAFDVLARDHHEIGHLVDDHHDEGQGRKLHRLLFVDRFAGLAIVAGLHRPHECLALGVRPRRRGR